MIRLLSTIFGGGLAEQLRRAYEAKLNAVNDAERISAEVTIAQLEARASTLAASAVSNVVQALWAAPFVIYSWKIVVYDKVLGAWTGATTDSLGEFEQNLGLMIAGFYFLAVTGAGVVRAFRR